MNPFLRWTLRIVVLLVVVLGGASLWAYWELKASLPILDGSIPLAQVEQPITIERDANGTVTITSETRRDVARGLGFVHGQERYFHMDLMRRRAAGELSALVGKAALDIDKDIRRHQLRMRAEAVVEKLSDEEQLLLAAYVEGVNEGRQKLGNEPFEYKILGTDPAPWQAADSILVAYSMYLVLQHSDVDKELTRLRVKKAIPEPLFAYFDAKGTIWDAPLWGEPMPLVAMPSAEQLPNWQPKIDLPLDFNRRAESVFPGSNNWAVAGELSVTGSAILQNDMHLGLQVPNVWFRASLIYQQPESIRITGVSLPGVPLMIAGSNGHIAWGFTNSYGDFSDVVRLEQLDEHHYQTPDGLQPIEKVTEIIEVKGETAQEFVFEKTRWGPVLHQDADGTRYAFRWLAHDVEHTMNFGLLNIEKSKSAADAVQLAQVTRMPSQNFLVTDKDGNIAWTIIGAIPKRNGCEPDLPISLANGHCAWQGVAEPELYPLIMNPGHGRLWTANNRVVSGEALKVLGDGGYDLGARAKQIRDGLFAKSTFTEQDLLDIALDARGVLLEKWRDRLIALLSARNGEENPLFDALMNQLKFEKDLQATDSAVAYRIVRAYRYMLRDTLYRAWLQPVYESHPDWKVGHLSNQWEAVLTDVLDKEPAHFLPAPFKSWQELQLTVLSATLEDLGIDTPQDFLSKTWGERNRASIRHPLSRFIPVVGKYLDAPYTPIIGDANMPRVAAPTFGASERMVVSPGHEERGIFHMPGGQSGHPLSPFYLAGHDDWLHGRPTPFLPGETVYTLKLVAQQR